jgi:hypothetical protein
VNYKDDVVRDGRRDQDSLSNISAARYGSVDPSRSATTCSS